MRRRSLAISALALLLPFLSVAPTEAATRRVEILDRGDRAIYTLRLGHAATASWGPDLLGPTRVIGIGEGRSFALTFDPSTCAYDLRARFAGGRVQIRSVDLCAVTRITFGR